MAVPDPKYIDEVLFGNRTEVDRADIEVVMEQYKLFVDTSERLVARRQVVNTFFLSANTLALSAIGLIVNEAEGSPLVAIAIAAIAVAAIVLCVAWKTLVRSYAQLNRGKFAVIDRLEERLPAAVFRAEWAALSAGRDPLVYKPFTSTEVFVSNTFIAIYGSAAVLTVGWLVASCL